MASGRPPGDAFGSSPRRRRRGGPSNEEGLRSLGSQIEGATGRGAAAYEGGLRTLGEQIDRNGPGTRTGRRRWRPFRGWSTRRKILVPVVTLVVLALVVVGATYGYARYRYDQISKVHVASEEQQVTGQPFNILVIGSDSRVGDKADTAQYGTQVQVGGQRSDVDMIWHVDPSTKQISIVSIPRDTLVSMVGKNVTTFGKLNRINSSYNSGPTLLVQTIQDNFGIPISHVIQVDFSGFKGAVDALGGVHMDFKYPARDALSGLAVTATGCQLLTGTKALAVARSRHYQYLETGEWATTPAGDLGRIKRQDAFLRSMVDAAKSSYDPLRLNAFLGSLPQGIAVDTHFSLGDMVGLAEIFHSINPTAIKTVTLPTFSVGFVTPWGDVLFVQQPEAQQLLESVFGSELTAPTSPPPNTSLVPTAPPSTAPTPTAAPASSSTSSDAGTPSAAPPTPTYDPTPC